MLDRADAILKLALAVAAVMLGCGVGYYYGLFLPGEARATAERADAAERAKLDRESKAAARKQAASARATEQYDACLSDAFANYSSRWEKTCVRLHKEDVAKRSNCLNQGYTIEYCTANYPIAPEQGCGLPSGLADSYDADHTTAKRQCLDELKAKSQSGLTPPEDARPEGDNQS